MSFEYAPPNPYCMNCQSHDCRFCRFNPDNNRTTYMTQADICQRPMPEKDWPLPSKKDEK